MNFYHHIKLDREKKRLEAERVEKRHSVIKEKLLKASVLLREISQEFSLVLPTINWSAKISPDDFKEKYKTLWSKVDEFEMLVYLYAPSTISKSGEDLVKLINNYWMGLYRLLFIKESVDCTEPKYLEIVESSQIILERIYSVKREIRGLN